jgi:hypothetical protein
VSAAMQRIVMSRENLSIVGGEYRREQRISQPVES